MSELPTSARSLFETSLRLIHERPDARGEIHQTLGAWYELFRDITGVDAYDFNGTLDIALPGGKALGVAGAAFCLLEAQRTAVFLRGLERAIRDLQQSFPGERIRILYAGCGPFATLLLPLSAHFRPEEIGWHLLDINPESLRAVKALHEALELQQYLLAVDCADASTFMLPAESPFHLVLSETMQRALQNETQLAIELNLLPQLSSRALFIPEEIAVHAEFRANDSPSAAHPLGVIYRIGQHHQAAPEPVQITLPDARSTGQLFLTTTVQVYGEEALSGNDTSITLPQPVRLPAGAERDIVLEYRWSPFPGFVAA